MQRRKVDLVVISDVHLGTYGCHADELVRYLKSIDPQVLILNGDIVDCWQFRKGFFPASHLEVIRQFTRFAARGVPVFYLTGNHDDIFRRFTNLELGQFQLRDQLELKIGGQKVLFFHGDLFDVSIRHARWLARLGGKSYEWLIRLNRLVNVLLVRLGRQRISFSHRIKHSVKKAVKFVNDFEQGAAEWGIARGCSVVVCGHIHQPAIREMHGAKSASPILYLNSGDWVENLSALEYRDGDWHLWRYEEEMMVPEAEEDQQSKGGMVQPQEMAGTIHGEVVKEDALPALERKPREEVFMHLDQVASLQLLLERERRHQKSPFPNSLQDW